MCKLSFRQDMIGQDTNRAEREGKGGGDVLGWIIEGGGDAGVDKGFVARVAVCGGGVSECRDWEVLI